MSQTTEKPSPNPKSSRNKIVYDHQDNIHDADIRHSDLNEIIKEA